MERLPPNGFLAPARTGSFLAKIRICHFTGSDFESSFFDEHSRDCFFSMRARPFPYPYRTTAGPGAPLVCARPCSCPAPAAGHCQNPSACPPAAEWRLPPVRRHSAAGTAARPPRISLRPLAHSGSASLRRFGCPRNSPFRSVDNRIFPPACKITTRRP